MNLVLFAAAASAVVVVAVAASSDSMFLPGCPRELVDHHPANDPPIARSLASSHDRIARIHALNEKSYKARPKRKGNRNRGSSPLRLPIRSYERLWSSNDQENKIADSRVWLCKNRGFLVSTEKLSLSLSLSFFPSISFPHFLFHSFSIFYPLSSLSFSRPDSIASHHIPITRDRRPYRTSPSERVRVSRAKQPFDRTLTAERVTAKG